MDCAAQLLENETSDAIAARFRTARRSGHPAWLWPEVPRATWQAAQASVAAVARAVLREGRSTEALAGDCRALGLACYTSGMGPLLGWWVGEGRLEASEDVAAMLAHHLRHARDRAVKIEEAAVGIIGRLHARGIRVAVLKGADTGRRYFPAPATRPAADIDLLVAAADADRAETVLAEGGLIEIGRGEWESSWRPTGAPSRPRSLWFVHRDDPWAIDVHRSLGVRAGASAMVAALDKAKPFDSGEPWNGCPEAKVLGQPLLLLHLAAHSGAGLHNLTLLRLVELRLVIARDWAEGKLSWVEFLCVGAETGTLGIAYPALWLAEKLVPGTVPGFVLGACAQQAPRGVARVVERLEPATAQRIDRVSLAEHFMWSRTMKERLGQVASDLLPRVPWRERAAIYERRMWQVLRGLGR